MTQELGTLPARSNWPTFAIGSIRCGSTLFRYLLNSHERISCPPESRFLEAFKDFILHPDFIQSALLFSQPKDIIYQSRKFVEVFLGMQARQEGKQRWVDKSPNYYRLLSFLDGLFEKQVLYLFLTRHPLDSIASSEEFLTHATQDHHDRELARIATTFGTDKYGCAKYWIDVYETIAVFRESAPQRCYPVKYEDLVRDPSGTIRNVLAFLGENPALLHLQHAFRTKTRGAQDFKFLATNEVHTNSIDRWKRWPPGEARAVWDVVKSTALRFGYSAP
jgi:Sulfotransferase family